MAPKKRKRDSSAPLTMEELLVWWKNTEKASGRIIKVEMVRVAGEAGPLLSISVRAYKPSMAADGAPEAEGRLRWPGGTGRTVLGTIFHLIIDVGDQLAALAEQSSLPFGGK